VRRELGRVSSFNRLLNCHHHVKDHVAITLRQRPPKPYKRLIFVTISVVLLKWAKIRDFHLSFFQMVTE